ncbi:MAG: geranylgeranyl diphosphate synthase, type [Patescibacteria group bacterium]|jgi:geranylgeranyl pyrophosphate synthase|nr:geranylgeranyl diphosphate synthase, type [Patescibacteria group bacterium]
MTPTEFREKFEPIFNKKINSLIKRAAKVSKSEEFNKVISHISKLSENGKRIRPYIINLAYGNSKLNQEIINQMVGVELLHLFALIHDDIMDGSSVRHGVKTINTLHKNGDLSKSYAMLAGDMVFNWAYECFIDENTNKESIRLFQTLIEEVIVGQAIDATLPHQKDFSQKELMEKNILKTARYTFRRPIEIGLVLAGKNLDKKYSQIGENLGIIFQIDDDLLDIFGDEKKLNKKTFQDIESKQATLISLNLKNDKFFKKVFGKKLNKEEKQKIKELIDKSGTLKKIEEEKNTLIKKTEKLIEGVDQKESWLALLEKISKRDK